MAFQKTGGIFKIAESTTLDRVQDWTDFKKSALEEVEVPEEDAKIENIDKEADFQFVADVDSEKFIYIHSTIMAGIKTGSNGYWVTPETEKYINDNSDAWTTDDLMKDHGSFKRATTFVEHIQDLEKARGKCIDVIARRMEDTVLIDVLFSVDRRHIDLVANIENKIINAVSMGCATGSTLCSICGNVASQPEAYCEHIKAGNKGRKYACADGKIRKSAEICKDNNFFDISLVANPAFIGAVFRRVLSSINISKEEIFSEFANNKIVMASKDGNSTLSGGDLEIIVSDSRELTLKKAGKEVVSKELLSEEEFTELKAYVDKHKAACACQMPDGKITITTDGSVGIGTISSSGAATFTVNNDNNITTTSSSDACVNIKMSSESEEKPKNIPWWTSLIVGIVVIQMIIGR